MIQYNPKDWFNALFTLHKADTFRALIPMLIFFIFYSWGVVYLETEYLKLTENHMVRNLTIMHTLLGFAISMLLVFRTNTAYDRWWEGRKLWGSLVNNSTNLALKIKTFVPAERKEDLLFFMRYIPFYSRALASHLNKTIPLADDENIVHYGIGEISHHPNFAIKEIMGRVELLHREGVLLKEHVLMLNAELQSFSDICGGCERIKNTPIPFSYSVFIKKFIFIYVGTLPFGFSLTLGLYTIPVTTFIFYVLASLELIAEEIEDPFGQDGNDLPMTTISKNIKNRVTEIMGLASENNKFV
jgi:putative membrane protein